MISRPPGVRVPAEKGLPSAAKSVSSRVSPFSAVTRTSCTVAVSGPSVATEERKPTKPFVKVSSVRVSIVSPSSWVVMVEPSMVIAIVCGPSSSSATEVKAEMSLFSIRLKAPLTRRCGRNRGVPSATLSCHMRLLPRLAARIRGPKTRLSMVKSNSTV